MGDEKNGLPHIYAEDYDGGELGALIEKSLPLMDLPNGFHDEMLRNIRGIHRKKMKRRKMFADMAQIAASCIITLLVVCSAGIGLNGVTQRTSNDAGIEAPASLSGEGAEYEMFGETGVADMGRAISPFLANMDESGINSGFNAIESDIGNVTENVAENFAENSIESAAGAIPESAAIESDSSAVLKSIADDVVFLGDSGLSNLVKNYYISIEVENLHDVMSSLDGLPGTTSEKNISDGTMSVSKLVPSGSLDYVTAHLTALGNVVEYSENQTTNTLTAKDELSAKAEEYERLLGLLDKAETVSELILLDGRISTVVAEMERLSSEISYFRRKTQYAEVHVRVTEVKSEPEQTFRGQIIDSYIHSRDMWLGFAENVIVFTAAAVLPIIITMMVICVCVLLCKKIARGGIL